MLTLHRADRVEPLARALAGVLAEPLDDPMAPEWVAVPTFGMRRWLALELARELGAGAGGGDGVAANIEFPFPGALRQAVLEAELAEGETDPWRVEHLVWAVLDVLDAGRNDERLGLVRRLPDGATAFGRARRLADLFDRYATRRPDVVLLWSQGYDADAAGKTLKEDDRWQPHLWRLVRHRIGTPSPPERLQPLLERLRAGDLDVALPPRLAVFGITSIPGGSPFLDLASALGAARDVRLFMLDPSPAMTRRVEEQASALGDGAAGPVEEDGGGRRWFPAPPPPRSEDRTGELVRHPLLRSWGRPYRERTLLLSAARRRGVPAPEPVVDGAVSEEQAADRSVGGDEASGAPATLLQKVQQDIRADRSPSGDFALADSDRSIQIHSCHGPARQVEVLRDAILHLLADDPTLSEDEIVVVCPSIERFAPLIEGGFGLSAEGMVDSPPGTPTAGSAAATPRLLYRVADRSIRDSSPVLSALDSLLELLSGRFPASELLEFMSLAPVGRRFGFDEEAMSTVADWVADTNVRWGLDGEHRSSWGVPATLSANTWRAALDRLLMGVAVGDGDLGLALGGVAPFGVEGDGISLAGRLADLVERLAVLQSAFTARHTAEQWCAILRDAAEQLFDVEPHQQWQLDQLRRILEDIRKRACVAGVAATVELTLADVRRLLADRLAGVPRRPDFFRGGITVSSLTPLRWLPARVVCVLGLDDDVMSAGSRPDGDDITAVTPRIGDPDPRAESRQALLEAVLAAGERLVITRSGFDVRTNREVPMSVPLAELCDTVRATLAPGCGDEPEAGGQLAIETLHPRQPFDVRCFEDGALGHPGPWSFDSGALAGARARAGRAARPAPFLDRPLPAAGAVGGVGGDTSLVQLQDLRSFLNHPVKAFLRKRLGIRLETEEAALVDDLPTRLSGLEEWAVADRLIEARLAGRTNAEWERHERALGTLPPGGLGDAFTRRLSDVVDELIRCAVELGVGPSRGEQRSIDVTLDDGSRLVGAVPVRLPVPLPGPASVTYSKSSSKQKVAAWVDLLALAASEPSTRWRSVTVRRGGGIASSTSVMQLVVSGGSDAERRANALQGLAVAVDCYRRGMREPLPLFQTLSPELFAERAMPNHWRARDSTGSLFGDGADDANRIAFGDLDLDELLAIRALPDDPPGVGSSRAERYAHYLWQAIEDTCERPS